MGALVAGFDAKSRLQEWCQGEHLPLPSYTLLSADGPPHDRFFRVEVRVEGQPPAGEAERPARRRKWTRRRRRYRFSWPRQGDPVNRKSGFVALLGRPTSEIDLAQPDRARKIAIVTRKPQTTRDRIAGFSPRRGADRLPRQPGIHKPTRALNSHMVRTACRIGEEADIVAHVIDDRPVGKGPEDAMVRGVLERIPVRASSL